MLARADADLVARDPALPGLALLLDDAALAERLAALAPDAAIESVRGCYLRYKHGTRCVAAYRVQAAGVEHFVHAVAHGSDAPVKLARSREQRDGTSFLGAGPLGIAPLALQIHAFPNDARIPYLRRLAEPDGARRLAKRAGAALARGTEIRLETLAYKPERRCVVRLGVAGGPALVLRLYKPTDFAASARTAAAFESRGALRVATRLGASERHGTVVLGWQEGEPLDPRDPAALARVGEALGELHGQPLPARATQPGREAVVAAAAIARLVPALADRARSLASSIAVRLAERRAPLAAVHGDLHLRQILVAGDQAVLLDLDRSGAGEPALDFGTFAAHLVGGESIDPDEALARIDAMLAGHRRVATPPDPAAIALHAAAAQIAIAANPFRKRVPEWPARIEESLAHAETWLARSRAPRRAARAVAASLDPGLPALAAALDPARAAAPLARALGPETKLLVARLVRHKPGRRALVEYEIERRGARELVLGKLRARGLDQRSLQLQRDLHRALAAGSTAVAEPLGAVPELDLWLQRKVAGVSGETLVGDAAFAARVGAAAFALHRSGVAGARAHGVADELHALHARLPVVAWLHPEHERGVARLLAACDRLAAALPESPICGIHRDLHPAQVLDAGASVVLLDLDLHCAGPAALDVGNYRAHQIEAALRATGDPTAHRAAEDALVERYLALAGESQRAAIDAWTWLALARHVYLSTQYPERRHTTAALLALALARLDAPRRDAA